MTFDHPIFTRWPAQYRSAATLFRPTPNGVKVGIMLYEARELVGFDRLQAWLDRGLAHRRCSAGCK